LSGIRISLNGYGCLGTKAFRRDYYQMDALPYPFSVNIDVNVKGESDKSMAASRVLEIPRFTSAFQVI